MGRGEGAGRGSWWAPQRGSECTGEVREIQCQDPPAIAGPPAGVGWEDLGCYWHEPDFCQPREPLTRPALAPPGSTPTPEFTPRPTSAEIMKAAV